MILKATLWLTIKTSLGREVLVNFTANATGPLPPMHDFSMLRSRKYVAMQGNEIVGIYLTESQSKIPLVRGIYERAYEMTHAQYSHSNKVFGGSNYQTSNSDTKTEENISAGDLRWNQQPAAKKPGRWILTTTPELPKTEYAFR
mmetsp:Transcript_34821/g.56000  ORF Transcript_34821/g.56000 Transcript_34821/m.56000 type:complete len:144 (+) Transcript_34821:400-831(+)